MPEQLRGEVARSQFGRPEKIGNRIQLLRVESLSGESGSGIPSALVN